MVCRKEGVWKGLAPGSHCGWCHVALLCFFRPEKQMKFFLLLRCVDLVPMRKISGNGEADAWFCVRCVCSDSGGHRCQRSTDVQPQRLPRGEDTVKCSAGSRLGYQVSSLLVRPGSWAVSAVRATGPSGVNAGFGSSRVPGLRPSWAVVEAGACWVVWLEVLLK